MEWTQFGILIITMGSMFMWIKSDIQLNRTESSADRRDMLNLIREIQSEIKDFHGRLCAIEEKNKGK